MPMSPLDFLRYSSLGEPAAAFTGASAAAALLRCLGTVWIVPQYWQRHTPPANASSMLSCALQLVQLIRIMSFAIFDLRLQINRELEVGNLKSISWLPEVV